MDNSESRWSRAGVDLSRYSAEDQTPKDRLGYSTGLSKREAAEMLKDSRFLQDVKDYFYYKDGKTFSSDEDAIEEFWSDRTWANNNVLFTGLDYFDTQGMEDDQKARLARLQNVYEQNPAFWEDGGRGASGFWQNAGAMLLDPVNLVGFGFGGVGAKAAAKAATMAGGRASAGRLAYEGGKRGAISEGIVGAPIEGVQDAMLQGRDMELGLQDEFSLSRTAGATALGAVGGAAFGGVLGAAAPGLGAMANRASGGRLQGLDARASGEAEGRAELQRQEIEAAQKAADEAAKVKTTEENGAEFYTQLEGVDADLTEQLNAAAPDLDTAIKARANDFATADEFSEAMGILPGSPNYDIVKQIFDIRKSQAFHKRMQGVPTQIQSLERQVQTANATIGRGGSEKIETTQAEIDNLNRRIVSQKAALDSYNRWLDSGSWRDTDIIPPEIRALENMLDPEPPTNAVVPSNPTDRGDGFTMRDEADEGAVQQQRASRGLDDPTIDPSRQIPEAPPGPRNVSGEGFEAVVDTSEAPQSTAPRTAAESELSNAQQMRDSAKSKRDEVHRQIKNLQAKQRRGSINEDETAELADLISSRTQLRKELKQAENRVLEAENLLRKNAEDAIVDNTEAVASVVEEEAENVVADAVAPAAPETPTLNDAAIETSGTEAGTLDFLSRLGFDKKDMRRELRARTAGVSRTEAKVIRASFAEEKLARLQAAGHVQAAMNMFGGADNPAVYNMVGMRAVIRSFDLPDEQTDMAMDVYNDFVVDNAPSILNNVVEGLGEGRPLDDYFDFIRDEFGEEMVDIINRQLTGDLDTLDRIVTKLPPISDFTKAEQDSIRAMQKVLEAEADKLGYKKPMIQMWLNQKVNSLREEKKAGLNPFRDGAHEGRTIENNGKITVNGKTYEGYRTAGTQSILKPAMKGGKDNPYKYYGQLLASLKRGDIQMTGREAAMRSMDEAKLEGASNAARKDTAKYEKKRVTNPETGKKETVHLGYNAEKVQKLDHAKKELAKLDPAEDARQIRDVLIELGVMPDVRVSEAKYRPQEIQLGLGINVRQQYPNNSTGFRTLRNGRQTDGSVWLLRRAIPLSGDALKRTSAGKINLDGPRPGRANIKVVGRSGLVEIPNYEVVEVDGRKIGYERVLASVGEEKETASGFLEAGGGDKAFYDPVTERLYMSREDVPQNQEGSTVADLIEDLNAHRKTLTQSTDIEIKAREVEEGLSSPERMFEAGYREYKQKARDLQQAKDKKLPAYKIQALDRAAKAQKKMLKDEYPELWKNRRVIKKGLTELQLAKNAGKLDDMEAQVAELADEAGEAITADDRIVAKVATDKVSAAYADAEKVSKAYMDAFERFKEHGDVAKYEGELRAIQDAAAKVSHEAPKTKPRGKRKPMVIKHNGVEVDLENHFRFDKATDEDTGYDLSFLGQKIGRVEQTEDGKFELHSDDLDFIPEFDSFDLLKRDLVNDFNTRIKLAFKEGKLQAADSPEEVSFHEPNHKNTKTYERAPEVDLNADEDELLPDFEGTDERLQQSGQDYLAQVPEGREFAIGIKTGRHAGVARVPRPISKLIGAVLGRQSGEQFVLGHVLEGSNGTAANRSFEAFDPDEDFSTVAKGQPKKERKSGKNELLEQDPDLEDPKNKPVSLNKTRTMEIDDATLPPDMRGKFKTVFDLHSEIINLERMPWSSPEFKTRADYQRFVAQLRTMYAELDKYAPHGIKLPNASRRASMNHLTALMHERPVGEINAVMAVLRNLSEGDSKMPRFIQDPNGYSHRPANYANTAELNAISIGADLTPDVVPSYAKVIHEIGHWAYFNVLTPAERTTFWDAMGKYMGDTGLNVTLIRKKLPEIGGNEMRSPQEFFATQFAQWAISNKRAGETTALMNLWAKVANKVQKIMRAFFVDDADAIDTDLIPLFERILPEDDMDTNKFMQVAKKLADAGPSVGFPAQKLAAFEDIRLNIERAIDTGNPDAIEEALREYVREAFAYSGKPGSKTRTNSSGKRITRVRLFDAKQIGEGPDGSKRHDFSNSYFVRLNLVKRMYAIQNHLADNPKKMLSEEDRLAEIDKLIASQDSGDFADYNKGSFTSEVMSGMAQASEDADEALVLLANDTLQAINEAQVELRRRIARVTGKTESGAGIKISPEGSMIATKDSSKGNQFRKRAQRRKKMLAENAEEVLQDTMSKLDAAIRGEPSKVASAPEGKEVPSPKGESILGMIERYAKIKGKKNDAEKNELGQEIANRMAAVPELTPLEELPAHLSSPDKFNQVSLHEALIFLKMAMKEGQLKRAVELQSYIGHKYGTLEIKPQLRSTSKAIDTEIAQTNGAMTENGIPGDAPQNVKNALALVSHRDRRVEYTGRTLLYRALNLLGRTEKDLVNQTDFVSFDDLYHILGDPRIYGGQKGYAGAQSLKGRLEDSLGFYLGGEGGANAKSPLVEGLRKEFRKLGTTLAKENAPLRMVAIETRPQFRGEKGEARSHTILHEVGHMLIRTMYDSKKMAHVQRLYDEALEEGNAKALEISRYYESNDAAEEFFVDELAEYLAGRVAKKDAFGEVRLKNGLERIVDEMTEFLAYMFNGLMRNKSLRQEFRHLTMYGDMFRVRKRAQQPVRQAQSVSGNLSMPSMLAPRYARETLDTMTESKRIAAREFTGAREGEDLMDFVVYHGTPNGNAFDRNLNPDVVLEPSGNGSLYGPGVYVTKSLPVADDYSRIGHRASFERMVADATDDPLKRKEGNEIIEMLIDNRERMNALTREMDSIAYSKQTQQRAKKIRQGELDMEDIDPDDMGYQLAYTQKKLADLVQEETMLWRSLEKATGVQKRPAVLPLFMRADNIFHADANTFYTFQDGGGSNMKWFVDEMTRAGVLEVQGAQQVLGTLRSTDFTGEDFYEVIIDAMEMQGMSAPDAKAEFTGFLKDMGFDSMAITEVNPANDEMIDAMVLFEPTQVKHVDAQTYDYENPEVYQLRLGGGSFLGKYADGIMDGDAELDIPALRSSMMNAAEKFGASKPVREFINKVSRKQDLTEDDIIGVQRAHKHNFLGENSSALRKNGAVWLGNIVKPSNGIGIFHKHNADLSEKLHPIMTALRGVSDYGGRAKRFYEKSKGLAAPLLKGARQTSQPPSHDRILRALRQDDISTLNPEERNLAQQLADVFAKELIELKEAGYNVGDITLRGKKFYVPQAFDTGAIQDNPRKFLNLMVDRFIKDRRAAGMPADRATAELAAKQMMERMLDTEGRIDTDPILNKKMQSDPFYQRMINLDPDEIPEFTEFMVNDLEGLVARYFDKSTRKLVMAREFGVQGHGYLSYRAVAEGGLDAAMKVLQSNKVVRSVRREMEVEAEIEDLVIPPMRQTDPEMKSILAHVQGMLDVKTTDKNMAKQAAVDYLYNLGEIYNMDIGMQKNWRKRVESVVNAMADFPQPAPNDTIKFMDKFFNVLNKRPVNGGDGTEPIEMVSRKVRAFNAVTLLGWTTLTSIPDAALPLVRSGNFTAWAKGMKQAMQRDPAYREAARDIGVGIENLIHDRMTHMAGEGSQRFSNAFFNATLLTPWTNFMREAAALVGFNALKAEAQTARRLAQQGKFGTRYKTAMRFLARYGLEDYGDVDGPNILDITQHKRDQKMRYAIMRFVAETIFTPDPNDIPLWSQTPVGKMVFQLKSFPVMMQRMVFGEGGIMSEAKQGNFKPLIAMLVAGSAFGAGSLAIKDLAQSRGGEDEKSRELRERKVELDAIVKSLGLDPRDFGTAEAALGWWLEGLMAVGGFGFLGELMYNSAEQLDNGAYGVTRIAGAIGGPAVGNFVDVVNVGAGVQQAVMGDGTGKARQAARTVAGRVPVLGGSRDFREGAADMMGDARSTRSKKRPRVKDPLAKYRTDI